MKRSWKSKTHIYIYTYIYIHVFLYLHIHMLLYYYILYLYILLYTRYIPASLKWPLIPQNGGHVFSPEKVTKNGSKRGHDLKNRVIATLISFCSILRVKWRSPWTFIYFFLSTYLSIRKKIHQWRCLESFFFPEPLSYEIWTALRIIKDPAFGGMNDSAFRRLRNWDLQTTSDLRSHDSLGFV